MEKTKGLFVDVEGLEKSGFDMVKFLEFLQSDYVTVLSDEGLRDEVKKLKQEVAGLKSSGVRSKNIYL